MIQAFGKRVALAPQTCTGGGGGGGTLARSARRGTAVTRRVGNDPLVGRDTVKLDMRPWRHRQPTDFRSRPTLAQAIRDHIAAQPGLTRDELWSVTAGTAEFAARIVYSKSSFREAIRAMLESGEVREENERLYPTDRLSASTNQ